MDLRQIDLNLLVALDALLREKHVTRAAQRLSVSQPAMSASLARLRRLLDDPLLVRSGRNLELTSFAESLQGPLRDILARIEQTLSARPGFDPTRDARTFVVAATDYITLVLLRRLMGRLPALAPNVRLQVEPVLHQYADQLRTGEIDLLVLPREVVENVDELASAELFTDRFVCAMAEDHPDRDSELTVAKFQELPYLAYRANGRESTADRELDEMGIRRNVEMTTESFLVAPMLLPGTRLIAMIHERLGHALGPLTGIRTVEPPVSVTPITQLMFWHPRRTDDPAHRWLREQLADIAVTLEDRPE